MDQSHEDEKEGRAISKPKTKLSIVTKLTVKVLPQILNFHRSNPSTSTD